MSKSTLPTRDEIDSVIFDMIAAEAAQVSDDTSLDEWSEACDPLGQSRAFGIRENDHGP
jgi:hypothetical protein